MKKQLGLIALSATIAVSALASANTGEVATGNVATGAVMTGEMTTGNVATGTIVDTEAKVKVIHKLLDEHFKKNNKKADEKKALITTLVKTLKDAATKLGKSFEHLKADYDFVISTLESYKI